jgi:hypothetical protein
MSALETGWRTGIGCKRPEQANSTKTNPGSDAITIHRWIGVGINNLI